MNYSSPLMMQRSVQDRNPFAPILSSPSSNAKNRLKDASCQTPKDLIDSKYKRPYLDLLKTIKQLQDKHSQRIQKLESEITVLKELLRTKKVEIQAIESLRGHHHQGNIQKKTKDSQVQTNFRTKLENKEDLEDVQEKLGRIYKRVFPGAGISGDSESHLSIHKILQDIEGLLLASSSGIKKSKESIGASSGRIKTHSDAEDDDQKGVNWDHLLHRLSLITPTKKVIKSR
jgi:hypothetical protein